MKAVVFPEAGTIAVEQVEDPRCAPDEVVVRVARSGICGTDLHIYRGEYFGQFPLIPGHEFGGEIVEVGKEVVMDLKLGDRVAVDPNLYCGYCEFCRREQSNQCLNLQTVGVTRAGGFAEYVNVPARACYRVPDALDDQQMAFIEPLACIVYGMKRMSPAPGDSILIFGAGPIGLLLLQALRHRGGGAIVVVDRLPDRLELATQLGATTTLLADDSLPERLREMRPHGFDVVVDATGVPAVIRNAFRYLRPRGQMLMFGVAPMGASIEIEPYQVFRNDWTILGSFALCYTFQESISWLENGIVDVAPLVSDSVAVADFADAFQRFSKGETLKVQIQMASL